MEWDLYEKNKSNMRSGYKEDGGKFNGAVQDQNYTGFNKKKDQSRNELANEKLLGLIDFKYGNLRAASAEKDKSYQRPIVLPDREPVLKRTESQKWNAVDSILNKYKDMKSESRSPEHGHDRFSRTEDRVNTTNFTINPTAKDPEPRINFDKFSSPDYFVKYSKEGGGICSRYDGALEKSLDCLPEQPGTKSYSNLRDQFFATQGRALDPTQPHQGDQFKNYLTYDRYGGSEAVGGKNYTLGSADHSVDKKFDDLLDNRYGVHSNKKIPTSHLILPVNHIMRNSDFKDDKFEAIAARWGSRVNEKLRKNPDSRHEMEAQNIDLYGLRKPSLKTSPQDHRVSASKYFEQSLNFADTWKLPARGAPGIGRPELKYSENSSKDKISPSPSNLPHANENRYAGILMGGTHDSSLTENLIQKNGSNRNIAPFIPEIKHGIKDVDFTSNNLIPVEQDADCYNMPVEYDKLPDSNRMRRLKSE